MLSLLQDSVRLMAFRHSTGCGAVVMVVGLRVEVVAVWALVGLRVVEEAVVVWTVVLCRIVVDTGAGGVMVVPLFSLHLMSISRRFS